MVIKALAKWINQNFPECATKTARNSVQCNTLFIDGFQLYFNALQNSEDHKSFIRKYLGSVKNVILSNHPTDKIFFFLDGPCPAIRYQKLRERWFLDYHIDGYVINSNEYSSDEIQEEEEEEEGEENAHQKLEEYFKRLINYDNVAANSIVYSSVSVPGEAKYKFFDYFREMKKSSDFVPSGKHVILSNTNEMFFLALQFIDEHFFVLKSNHFIYDIHLLRNCILYHMAIEDPFPGLKDGKPIDNENLEKRKMNYESVVSKMSDQLKQQIINDVIALSIVVSSENFPPFPEIKRMGNNAYTYAKLLNTYKELNQPYIENQIKNKSNKEFEFTPLIVNDCFELSSLKKIMKKFMQTYVKKNHSQSKKIDTEVSIKSNDEDEKETNLKSKHKRKEKTSKSKNIFDTTIESNEHKDSSDSQNEEEEKNDKSDENDNDNDNDDDNGDDNDDDNGDDNDDDNGDDNDDEFNEKNVKDYPIESQQLFRLFNFTWKLYTEKCISWSFYYQFKETPPLEIALDLMKQENLDVFETEDSDEKPTPMFKCFIIYPVEVDDFPYCLYKLKLPGSPISQFWPLGATDPKDIPIIDLKLIKKFYKKAMDEIPENHKEGDTIPKTYEIKKKQKKKKTKRYYDHDDEYKDIFKKTKKSSKVRFTLGSYK